MRVFFSSPHPRCRWHIPRPRYPFTPPRSGRKSAKKQPPRNSTGAAFTYLISIFQSGFAPAAKATKELNTRFHRLSTHAHPNKSGIIFPAFIGFYRDITKAIYNPLRPCNTPYKRLYRIRGYKIATCAAVLFSLRIPCFIPPLKYRINNS